MKGLMGGLYRLAEWIMRFSFINLLWLVCSLFIPFILLMVLYAYDPAKVPVGFYYMTFLTIGAVAPFTFFPATSAMFTIVRKFVQGRDDAPIVRTFFKGFKENYLKSMFGGIVFVLLYFIIYFNYTFYVSQDGGFKTLAFVFLFFTILVIIAMFHFFNFIVNLDLKFGKLLKNSLLMAIGSPVISLTMLLANAIILYVSYFQFTFLVPFFTGSMIAFTSYWLYQRSFDRIVAKAEALQSKDNADMEQADSASQEDLESKS